MFYLNKNKYYKTMESNHALLFYSLGGEYGASNNGGKEWVRDGGIFSTWTL